MTDLAAMLRFDRAMLYELRVADGGSADGGPLVGVDEAGRGPLAGPVVAAAVVLPPNPHLAGLRDSKLLTAGQRDRLFQAILRQANAVAVGAMSARTVDEYNILGATQRAMAKAVARLRVRPRLVLVDGNQPVPQMQAPQQSVVKGDARSASIAAASIIAKVSRDRIMQSLDRRYPGYGFAQHKGYPTRHHLEALRHLGPSREHRRTFRGVPAAAADCCERLAEP